MKNFEDAKKLFLEYNKTESLINHGLTVASVMRYMAKEAGEDEELWAIAGLLHDIDYEMFPNEHCTKAQQILQENGFDDVIVRAVMSHGYGICTDVEPQSLMEKTLYAIDELSGLIMACVLVRPSKSVLDLEVSSVKKKWKQKSFAAGANREIIQKGIEMLGSDRDTIIAKVIEAMRANAQELGIKGDL
jgi:putative nucleotidyltransferase with HDIG domain